MIKNYLKIAWRNIAKHKVFSAINILGLAMGVTCSLLIALWVIDEYQTDSFHEDIDRIYTVYERQYYDGKIEAGYYTPGVLAEEMKKVLPGVEYATGMSWNDYHTFAAGDKSMKFEGTYTGNDFFNIFSFPIIHGSKDDALSAPESVAISRNMANSFYGSPEAAINQTLKFENEKDLTITAIYDIPERASRKFQFLLNWDHFLEGHVWAQDWTNNGPQTYFKLKKGIDTESFEANLTNFLDNYNKEQGDDFHIELGMQRFDRMYLESRFHNGEIVGGRIEYVRIFSIVAIFILFIACINFMNLATAQSGKRAREIGVRKVIGAYRAGLIRQFISESILITLFSVVLAVVLVIVLLPVFNTMAGKSIQLPFDHIYFWLGLILLVLTTGLIAGSYPSFLLSSFRPVITLKGGKSSGSGNSWMRKGLVVFQFTLSILFVAGTIVVSRQVNFIQNVNLGYEKENLLYIPLDGKLFSNFETFKAEAGKIPGIESISRISQRPVEMENGTGGVDWDGKDPESMSMFTYMAVGYDFVKNMKVEILEGRDFSKEFATDSTNYIVNESALAKIGYKDPIGKRLSFWGNEGIIVGVVKDFHFNTLHVPIEPMIIRLGKTDDFSYAVVRTGIGQTQQAIQGLESFCERFNPEFPFAHQFADKEYTEVYQSENTVRQLSGYFAFLAIFISCLGLLGLAMYTAEQRTQELGIRKVLGANIQSLFALLSKEYVQLMLIAFVISVPLSLWALDSWLQNYAYKIEISWWMFAVAGMSVMLIAILTVSFQVLKAAFANPVKAIQAGE